MLLILRDFFAFSHKQQLKQRIIFLSKITHESFPYQIISPLQRYWVRSILLFTMAFCDSFYFKIFLCSLFYAVRSFFPFTS